MHRLSYLKIENYRACKEVSLTLESYTSLVGPNNTGKSSILEAIQWVLKPTALADKDFFNTAKPIVVSACIAGITTALLDSIPEPKHKKAIEPYCANNILWIRATALSPGKKDIKQEVFDHTSYSGKGIPTAWREYPTGLPQAVSALLPEPLFVEAMEDIGEDLGKAKAGSTIKNLLR